MTIRMQAPVMQLLKPLFYKIFARRIALVYRILAGGFALTLIAPALAQDTASARVLVLFDSLVAWSGPRPARQIGSLLKTLKPAPEVIFQDVQNLYLKDQTPKAFNLGGTLQFVRSQKITHIIMTDPESVRLFKTLREQGETHQIWQLWWVPDFKKVTDPALSHMVDFTFLPHPEMKQQFAAANIPGSQVVIAGLPPRQVTRPFNREQFLRKQGISPQSKVVVLGARFAHLFPFYAAVESILETDPVRSSQSKLIPSLHIVALTGGQKQPASMLKRFQMPSATQLKIENSQDPELLHQYIRAADLYVTSGHPMSFSDALIWNIPMIVFDTSKGAHQHDLYYLTGNRPDPKKKWDYQPDLGLAIMVENVQLIGDEVFYLFEKKTRLNSIKKQQEQYLNQLQGLPMFSKFIFEPNTLPSRANEEPLAQRLRQLRGNCLQRATASYFMIPY